MSKKNRGRQRTLPARFDAPEPRAENKMSVISFGGIEEITSPLDYVKTNYDTYNDYYIPPIDRQALSKIANIAAYHGAVLRARTTMVAGGFVSGGGMSQSQMRATALNLLMFGDVALLKVRNAFGAINRLQPLPSMYLRRRKNGKFVLLQRGGNITYSPDDIIFITQYDPEQQIYGIPDYLGGLQSAMLNFEATRFRQKYYKNGAHLGYILYATDPDMSPELEIEIRKKIEESKGAGNFRSMFINIPNGKAEGVKIIPVGDTGAKDEFVNIKNISAQDQLVAHRFPAGLAGIIPQNSTGLGDPLKYREAYRQDEIIPMQNFIAEEINNGGIPARLRVSFDNKPVEDAGA